MVESVFRNVENHFKKCLWAVQTSTYIRKYLRRLFSNEGLLATKHPRPDKMSHIMYTLVFTPHQVTTWKAA